MGNPDLLEFLAIDLETASLVEAENRFPGMEYEGRDPLFREPGDDAEQKLSAETSPLSFFLDPHLSELGPVE